jgi:Subtilase family
MRESRMKWNFRPRSDADGGNGDQSGSGGPGAYDPARDGAARDGAAQDRAAQDRAAQDRAAQDGAGDASAAGLAIVPPDLLARHGGRVLIPAQAAQVPRWPVPQSTVYRARTLLVPGDLLADPAFLAAANAVLARVGMRLVPVVPDRGEGGPAGGDRAAAAGVELSERVVTVLRRLPRLAVLVPAIPDGTTPPLPVVIDAWVALQTLRAASGRVVIRPTGPDQAAADQAAFDQAAFDRAEAGQAGAGQAAAGQADAVLDEAAVRRISLEHLLVGSAINGTPIWHTNGTPGGSDESGGSEADSTGSYLFTSGDSRSPVTVCLAAPARTDGCDRRPVVAVLDTGVRAHTWLDVQADPPGYATDNAIGFVAVDQALQDAINAAAAGAVSAGDQPRHLIRHPWDAPVTGDPLIGELDTDTGHGTFIAGLVRQVAPDAQVLSVRVTHSDGVVYESDLTCALSLLAERIAIAEAGGPAGMVDVVSLSLGYFSENAADVAYSSGLWQIIDLLLELGVPVIAAAGNYATRRRFYPAAFTLEPVPAGQLPVISVGARNPNDTTALFSDAGRWVTTSAPGAALVSTFPMDINGSASPQIMLPDGREGLDPDDYSAGFAIWSGTSFAAPLLAADFASALLAVAADPLLGPGLTEAGAQAARDRAIAALQLLGWQG